MEVHLRVLLVAAMASIMISSIGLADNNDPGFNQGLIEDGGPWEVRWFNYPDAANIASGWLPTWVVTVDDEKKPPFENPDSDYLYIDDPDKKAMASVAVGQRLAISSNLIPTATFTVEYQARCESDARCASVWLVILPEKFWDEVGMTEPLGGDEKNTIDAAKDAIWSQQLCGTNIDGGADVVEWEKGEANTAELRAALTGHGGEMVVVGIVLQGSHIGSAETAMFDNLLFTGGSLSVESSDGKLAVRWAAIKAEY